jgi:hypothetical protein
MACDNCFQEIKQQQADLEKVKQQAKEYALANQKNIFIYKDETGYWQYMEEEAARSINIFPTGGVVSFY